MNKQRTTYTLETLPPLLTMVEAGEMLKAGPSTIQRWVKTGALKTSKVGRRRYVPATEIRRIVEAAG